MARKSNTAIRVSQAVVDDVSEAIGEDVLAHIDVPVEVVPTVVTYPTTEEMIAKGMTTKSSRIRHLHSLGMKTGPIAKQECNGLYQHAFNVINKPLKTGKARDDASKAEQEPKIEEQPADVAAPAAEETVTE